MDSCDIEDIWKILKEHKFQLAEKTPPDLVCLFCNKLLINAHICPCGCRYCKNCIEGHVLTGNSKCIGSKSECEDEILFLSKNVWVDHVVNRKIAKLKFQCPTRKCNYQDFLVNVYQHWNTCKKQSIKCPFFDFGCDYINLDGDDISQHLKTEQDKHIDVLAFKVNTIQIENECLHDEIYLLEKDSKHKQIHMDEMARQLENLKLFINAKLDHIIENQEAEKTRLLSQLEEKQDVIDGLHHQLKSYLDANIKEFVWNVGKLPEMKLVPTRLVSDEFFTHSKGYKMQLELTGSEKRYYIRVKMVNGTYNQSQDWPVHIEATVGIVSESCQEFKISETQTLNFVSELTETPAFVLKSSDCKFPSLTFKCYLRIVI